MKQAKDYPEELVHTYTTASGMRAPQSKLESALEVGVNIASGFVVSYLVWIFIVPVIWSEHASTHGVAFGITVLFTISSVIRGYVWRRLFEREVHKKIHQLFRG